MAAAFNQNGEESKAAIILSGRCAVGADSMSVQAESNRDIGAVDDLAGQDGGSNAFADQEHSSIIDGVDSVRRSTVSQF